MLPLLAIGQLRAQQIPNNSFENWTDFSAYEDPDNWISLNLLSAFGGQQIATKSTDAHSGNYALELSTSVSDIGSDGTMDTIPGTATLGIMDLLSGEETEGAALSTRPDSLTGWYKLAAPDGASCYVLAMLSKWNGNSRTDIGAAIFNGGAQNSYNRFSVPFQYLSNETPDTITITILNSDDEQVVTNVLTIDDLALTNSSSAGLNDLTLLSTLYPNPVNNLLYLKNHEPLVAFEIIDMQGKTILSVQQPAFNETLDVQTLTPGTYTVKSTAGSGHVQFQKLIKL